jgi:hypothetical protein
MHLLGIIVGLGTLVLEAVLLCRAKQERLLMRFPFFYSYLACMFLGTVAGFVAYWARPSVHPSVYWFHYLLTIVVEFAVLLEISDHIFQPFPAIRNLGRSLTILISVVLGTTYILPAILWARGMRMGLLDFALRASLTKALILAGLFYAARHFGLKLGRNVAGLMLGFSIYLGVNIANFACVERFGNLYASILWVMSPIAYTLCLVVWTGGLWEYAPMAGIRTPSAVSADQSESLALELTRFNNRLSRFLHK